MNMRGRVAGLVLMVWSVAAVAGCAAPEPVSSPSPSIGVPTAVPSPSDGHEGVVTPEATISPDSILAALEQGRLPVEIPDGWGQAIEGPSVSEGYLVQENTWPLGASGSFVTGIAMTPGQAEVFSGGRDFTTHVQGMAAVLAPSGFLVPTPQWLDINGIPAALLEIPDDAGMGIVMYVFDLGEAYYEWVYYSVPGDPSHNAQRAEFEAVANTVSVPGHRPSA